MSDTIFALASAPGRAGVAVLRVSGPQAGAVLDGLISGTRPAPRAARRPSGYVQGARRGRRFRPTKRTMR